MGEGLVLGFGAAIAALMFAGYLLVASGALPSGQDSKPSKLEKWAASTSLQATMRREARGLKSPIDPSDDNLVAGAGLYRANCQVCHGGADGVLSSIARGLSPRAPQLAKDGVEDDPDGVIYWKVAHGIRFTGMPGFGETLSEREMWQISLFVETPELVAAPSSQRLAGGEATARRAFKFRNRADPSVHSEGFAADRLRGASLSRENRERRGTDAESISGVEPLSDRSKCRERLRAVNRSEGTRLRWLQ